MKPEHYSGYDEETTARCERALVTVLGNVGLWRERIYLAGGLVPRYLVGKLPEGSKAHIGTMDVDLAIGLAVESEPPDTYFTLETNLERAGFRQEQGGFRWLGEASGARVVVELLGESDSVEPGRSFRPKQGAGSHLALLNIPGVNLVAQDYVVVPIERERLDGRGLSRVEVRVANVLPYAMLKMRAFQDRHENKDAYDLIFTLRNYEGGPTGAGAAAAQSRIVGEAQVEEALTLIDERFAAPDLDGPIAYARFVTEDVADEEAQARDRQEAVSTTRAFLRELRSRTV